MGKRKLGDREQQQITRDLIDNAQRKRNAALKKVPLSLPVKAFRKTVAVDETGWVVGRGFNEIKRPASVAEYFHAYLGEWLDDDTKTGKEPWSPYCEDFHIFTGCGRGCRETIDAAAEMVKEIRDTLGEDGKEHVRTVVAITQHVVLCQIYG